MSNGGDGQQQQHKNTLRRGNSGGFLPSSFRAISSYLRIVSSGASTVAKSAASAAHSIVVEREDEPKYSDQVYWAGFDKLETEGNIVRHVLLLGYRSGFQVWDVEEADNVHDLVSRQDGPVASLQMLPKPIPSKSGGDKFANSRPLVVVCSDGFLTGACDKQNRLDLPSSGTLPNYPEVSNGNFVPTTALFYSLKSHSYVHVLKFRSAIYSVRCSSRVVAISQAAQIHCFDATTLEREYTILTNPIVQGLQSSVGIGYGPLAVGPRWLAYSGSPVVLSNTGRVCPQHLAPSMSLSGLDSNKNLVAQYAKESSKQLASGVVTLGDKGYKKLTRYCSELLSDPHGSVQSPSLKENGVLSGHFREADSIGMVIIRDIVSKHVVTQFRSHKSPISALCFDPSGTLLVTASVQGHNINVFKIMPGFTMSTSTGNSEGSYVHLYRLQRGLTNAVIQDISFSDDCQWIMISSSRGTSHLFAINPFGGSVKFDSNHDGYTTRNGGAGMVTKSAVRWPPSLGFQMRSDLCASGPPVTLSAVSRIRNGSNGWKGTVSGAASAATGRLSSVPGVIASSFHNCKGNSSSCVNGASPKKKYYLLVFSASGCMVQYTMQISAGVDSSPVPVSSTGNDVVGESDGRLVVDAIQKWNICHKQHRKEREDNVDIYGDNGHLESSKIYPECSKKVNSIHPEFGGLDVNAKRSSEEKYPLYISEAELQMYQPDERLWEKAEIYFQSVIRQATMMGEESGIQGELEVERIPTRFIEARRKGPVPVFDRVYTPANPALDNQVNQQLQHQSSGLSENGQPLYKTSSSSLGIGSIDHSVVPELHNRSDDTRFTGNGLTLPVTYKGSVNSSHSPRATNELEIVNNRESSLMDAHLKFANNSNKGLTKGNHFEDSDGFD
ncbi:Autophagy-related protein 18f [Linum perenne]